VTGKEAVPKTGRTHNENITALLETFSERTQPDQGNLTGKELGE
jgi:hypothetical protein